MDQQPGYSNWANKRRGVAQVLDGLFGTPLRKIWSLTTFLIASCAKRWTGSLNPPARPCTSLVLAAPPAPRCWTGGSHPPSHVVHYPKTACLLRRTLDAPPAPSCANFVILSKSACLLREMQDAGLRPPFASLTLLRRFWGDPRRAIWGAFGFEKK